MSREEKQQELYELVTRNFQLADEMKRQKSEVRVDGVSFIPALDASLADLVEAAAAVPDALVHDPFHGLKMPEAGK